jgi:hypothetical protein
MATLALTLWEYNDLRVRAALRTAPRHTNPVESVAHREIPGRSTDTCGNPHPAREFETGSYDGRTRAGGRRGGRPRVHPSRRQAQAAAARAYRARRRLDVTKILDAVAPTPRAEPATGAKKGQAA